MSDAVTLEDSCSYQLRLKCKKLRKMGYKAYGSMQESHIPITSGAAKGYESHNYRQLMIKEN